MSAVSTPAPQAEWYLARDGQQFGPLSDQELRKLVEFGHLKTSDLLWREGFPEWRSARILLPETAGGPKLPNVAAPVAAQPASAPGAPAEAPTTAQEQAPAHSPAAAPLAQAPAQAPMMQSAPVTRPSAAAQVPVQAQQPQSTPRAPSQAAPAYAQAAPSAAPLSPSPTTTGPMSSGAAAPSPAALGNGAPRNPGNPTAPAAARPMPQPAAAATVPIRPAHAGHAQSPAPASAAPMHGAQSPMAPSHMQPMPQPADFAYTAPSAPIADARSQDAARPAPRLGPQPSPRRRQAAAPVAGPDFEDDEVDERRGGVLRWLAWTGIIVFFIATLSAAGLYAYPHRDDIATFVKNLLPASLMGPPPKSPLVGFAPTVEETDAALQGAPLWRTLKREFPEWYEERIKEAAALARAQKPEAQIGEAMMAQVMLLRRKHAGDALSATSLKLRGIAASFAENLVRLRDNSVEACHGFITAGETHPAYLKVLRDPAQTGSLQVLLAGIFEAVAEGRKVPRVYPQPKQVDFNTVVELLQKRGWSNADMRLFSDYTNFSKTEPEKMCKMVIDWFQAQLEIKDSESQMRLLSDALKPVIAG